MPNKDSIQNSTFNGYERKVDKVSIPVCNIMGVNIAAINMQWLITYVTKHLSLLSGDYIAVSNVHTTCLAYQDETYRKIQNSGVMAIPDGGPLSSIGRKRGHRIMTRTTGPNFMVEILSISCKNNYRHYFYGCTEETLFKLKRKLLEIYPDLQIVGSYSPPFRPLTDSEDVEIISKINVANADFIWIGLGAPKQEEWMAKHQGKLHGLMIGVGAGFDFLAGNIDRAPTWMQNTNLEWLFRLLQEPRRLFSRYFITNTIFIWNAVIRGK